MGRNKNQHRRPIVVVAPQDLPGGFPIPVVVDGETITITVPDGGVQEGDEICRFYDENEEEETVIQSTEEYHDRALDGDSTRRRASSKNDRKRRNLSDSMDKLPSKKLTATSSTDEEQDREVRLSGSSTPTSSASARVVLERWRTHLFGCCDVVTQSTFWMALFLPPVLIGQLLNRLNLNYQGKPDRPEETSLSYNKILISFIFCLILGLFFPGISLIFVFLYLVVLYSTTLRNTRKFMRQKYHIKSRIDDGFCTVCCSCCVLIQMVRHTHDDKEYPGYCCTTNGLDIEAPPPSFSNKNSA